MTGTLAAFLGMRTSSMVTATTPDIEQVIATIALDAAGGGQPAYRLGVARDRIVVEVFRRRGVVTDWVTVVEVALGTYDVNAHGPLLAAELRAGAHRALR
jgi:hypothetical protein